MNKEANKDGGKIRALFSKKQEAERSDLDAFEKEALEGFEQLSEDEALALKNELDRQIDPVFSKRPQAKQRVYWAAAAGLALLVGFTIYFIRNDVSQTHNNDLAITQDKKEPGLKNAESPKGPVNDSERTTPSKKEKAVLYKFTPNGAALAGTARKAAAPAERKNEAPMPVQKEKSDNTRVTNKYLTDTVTVAEAVPQIAMAKQNEVKKKLDAELEEEPQKLQEEADDKSADIAVVESKRSNTQRAEKVTVAPQSVPAVVNTATLVSGGSVQYSTPQGGYAPPSYEINSKGYVIPEVSYEGGEAKLNKELKAKLVEKALDKKFEALLYLNVKNVVEKVKFINTGDLNPTQIKELEEVLKTLGEFRRSGESKKTLEYRLNYLP